MKGNLKVRGMVESRPDFFHRGIRISGVSFPFAAFREKISGCVTITLMSRAFRVES